MKKMLKKSLALLVLLSLSLTFSSCSVLDDLKEKHAVFTNEEQTEIEYKGNLYHPLEDVPIDISVLVKYDWLNLTEKDVPVLLSSFYREHVDITHDESLIIVLDRENGDVYCKDDVRERISETIKTDKFDNTYALFEDYYNLKDILIPISDSLVSEIEDIMSGEELNHIPDYYSSITIGKFDESRVLYKDYVYLIIDTNEAGKNMLYLSYYTEDEEHYYRVTNDKKHLFDYLIEINNSIEGNSGYIIKSDWIVYE